MCQYQFTIDAFEDQIHFNKVSNVSPGTILPPEISHRALHMNTEDALSLKKNIQMIDLYNSASNILVKEEEDDTRVNKLNVNFTDPSLKPNTILGICENRESTTDLLANVLQRQDTGGL